MLRFKQFLLTEETFDYKILGAKNKNQNLLNLTGLSPERRKELEKIQSSLDDALKNNDGRLFDTLKTQLDNIDNSEDIRRVHGQNYDVRYETGIDTDIDTRLPPDLQKLQRDIRATKVEKTGYLPPHEEVRRAPILSATFPTSSDLEELEKMGVVDAKNYRPDERGVLYRPGPLPSEEERKATAIRATDAANVGGGARIPNTPEAKEFRSNALRDYYIRIGRGREGAQQLGAAGLAAAGAITGSALTQGAEAFTDVLGMVGAPPTGKDRMQIEKDFQSDVGLEFDLSPEGELEMNPAGREAVRKRQNRGINFLSMFRR
jgi:hypothetical protein